MDEFVVLAPFNVEINAYCQENNDCQNYLYKFLFAQFLALQ